MIPRAADLTIIGLTLMAAVFEGSSWLWARTVLLFGAAVLILFTPPRRRLSWPVTMVCVAFGLWSFLSCLPATWFPEVPWRRGLVEQFGVSLPATFTPQPWLTLEVCLLVVLGLTWGYYLLAREWHFPRRLLLELFAWGVLLITLYSFFDYVSTRAFRRQVDEIVFGMFPNRNQMGNFMALGAMVMLGLAVSDFADRQRTAALWLGAWAVEAAAIVVNGSRAGLLLLAVGTVAWMAWTIRAMRSLRWLGAGVAGALLGLTAILLFGGPAVERLGKMLRTSRPEALDLRVLMWKDAAVLARDASWHGVGPANFPGVFTRYRDASKTDQRAAHPESDWLWLAVTMGWPAVVLAAVAVALLLARCWPPRGDGDDHLRAASLLGVGLFVLHSLVDVSGHCPGTLWPAMFVLAMAGPLEWQGGPARFTPRVFRVLAVAFVAIGVWWFASLFTRRVPPTSHTIEIINDVIEDAIRARDLALLRQLSDEALRFTPLSHRYYFIRAAVWARTQPTTEPALRDFRIARYLEPNPRVAYDEGVVWLERGRLNFSEAETWIGREPELALAAWRVAMQQRPEIARRLYTMMLDAAKPYPEMTGLLREFAGQDPELRFAFLLHAPPGNFQEDLDELLGRDPELKSFTPEQRERVLIFWSQKGDRDRLEALLPVRPEWREWIWPWWAGRMASRGDFRAACDLAERFARDPGIDLPPADQPLERLHQEYRQRPRDLVAGLALYRGLSEAHRTDEALDLLQQLTVSPDAPKALHYFHARLLAGKAQWEKAWAAWRRFLGV